MRRERKTLLMKCVAPPGVPLFDQRGHLVGQALSCQQHSDETWMVEVEVDADVDLERLQVMPNSPVVGSINNG